VDGSLPACCDICNLLDDQLLASSVQLSWIGVLSILRLASTSGIGIHSIPEDGVENYYYYYYICGIGTESQEDSEWTVDRNCNTRASHRRLNGDCRMLHFEQIFR